MEKINEVEKKMIQTTLKRRNKKEQTEKKN